ncbi:aminoglycoside phosphotransferase [Hirsutella rhossiliensis]
MDDTPRLPLLGGETIGLRSAETCPDNILVELEYPRLDNEFRQEIIGKKNDIEAMVCHLLGIRAAYMWGEGQWQSGSFNLAIPIEVGHGKRVFLRLPLPYRNANLHSADEKLRTEIATYIWMEDHCPERNYQHALSTGYLLLSEAKGKCLAKYLEHRWHDERYMHNLCRSMARISLSMNKIRLPRIGSWHFNPDGTITLSNRPLHLHISLLESQGVPSGIPQGQTYAAVESYLSDILAFHDNIIKHQPNAVLDQQDGRTQLATLTGLRAVMHHFITPSHQDNPFYLCLTDLRPANIFVDEAGNITTIIDLEFSCARPVSMQLPPYWLTSTSLDVLAEASTLEHDAIIRKYLDIYEAEEKKCNGDTPWAKLQRHAWDSGAFWYNHAVMAPNHAPRIFQHRIHSLFNYGVESSVFKHVFSCYWSVDAEQVIQRRVEESRRYTSQIQQVFSYTDKEHE